MGRYELPRSRFETIVLVTIAPLSVLCVVLVLALRDQWGGTKVFQRTTLALAGAVLSGAIYLMRREKSWLMRGALWIILALIVVYSVAWMASGGTIWWLLR